MKSRTGWAKLAWKGMTQMLFFNSVQYKRYLQQYCWKWKKVNILNWIIGQNQIEAFVLRVLVKLYRGMNELLCSVCHDNKLTKQCSKNKLHALVKMHKELQFLEG